MNEKEIAKQLKKEYIHSKNAFNKPLNICRTIDNLKNIDIELLKQEVSKLGYKIEYGNKLKKAYLTKVYNKEPILVFYQNKEDL